MLEPRGRGIVLWTLRYGDGVRDLTEYFAKIDQKADPDAMKLFGTLIADITRPWSPEMLQDTVRDRLLKTISAKQKGRKKPAKTKPAATKSNNVVSMMDALKRSIAAEKARDKWSARAGFIRLWWHGSVAEALPRVSGQCGKAFWQSFDREVSWPNLGAKHVPSHQGGHRSTGAGAGRIGGNRRGAALIAQIIGQNLALAFGFADGRNEQIRGVCSHRICYCFGEGMMSSQVA